MNQLKFQNCNWLKCVREETQRKFLNISYWGFPKLNLGRIELIELISIAVRIVNINLCTNHQLPITMNKLPCDKGISCRPIFTVNSK